MTEDIFSKHNEITMQGLTPAQHREIRALAHQVVALFARADCDPRVAYVVLLNCLGSLIGSQMADDRALLIARVQTMLPFYVEGYRVREISIKPE